ncbi:dUTP diphosphatase [Collinsella aerofaciens]|uniref:dUTP diphosphatase n=1 Tax=Collinsella aerofaciens TaxID=74426 RepID=UPI003D7B0806
MKASSNIQVIQAQFDGPELKPIYAHGVEDAGCDLKANIPSPITIAPWKSAWVGTGVHLAMPEGMFALQAPRSGIACNAGITLANSPSIIDPGYRGEIRCKLVNLSDEPYTVRPFERIAQLVFLPFVNAVFTEADSLPESSRGEDGYGSTGAM